ncbi:histidine kinase OS=Tsukamurella paurometabola (strain ATCC 8368 / DSM / CCUG 35730 / CIP 100753/ JCM 10117 / KCTC 9821 / NBRC 16120 / NCIMB 702349 / NCTC 13040) OX=521096 GN=Tpau_0648 PE=4 SV=1 [Tsukamurella paurometabola]|uniref:histidine kinase n=1 Tax=Tsukamurella paurometabola (strain ATCC 8368 / DSM 20162 / CCUG 35730 / CIP 100753 / JCM 10117 / KCTC 9821 / NBRC 16120 / NCIMB 702349 / NCTC 13040) TaxID=521096 RepID=D5USZ8_TSUPD|nr:histidine kinase [Tsukamurella paurometabola]ADG77285.1 integral membrane sensor signal transduction histidine kinase [Tsukamurella paurometabola DSM 20162]SUP43385.1 Sensor histidine kinase desK [Tsukamurella paurometabola]
MREGRADGPRRRPPLGWADDAGIRVRDVLWAVVVIALGTLMARNPSAAAWEQSAYWVAVVALGAAVLIRATRTGAATALAIGAGVAFASIRYFGIGTVVIGYVLIFSMLGASRDRLWRTVGAVGIVAGGLTGAAWAIRASWPEFSRARTDLWSVIGFCALAAAMVCLVGYVIGLVRRQRAAAAAFRVARAEQHWADRLLEQERERSRLAREMHDVVAHSLAVIVMQSQGARYIQDSDPARASAALETIGDVARDALADVRTLLGQLRTGTSATRSRDDAVRDLDELVARLTGSGLVIRFDGALAPPLPDWVHDTDASLVLPELLINAAKHGDAAEPITLTHRYGAGRTTVTVHNAIGPGSTEFPRGGNGLVGLHELLAELHGSIEAHAESGWWTATVVIPDPVPTELDGRAS